MISLPLQAVEIMTELALSIRPLAQLEEFKEAETVQCLAWRLEDATNAVPLNMLVAAQRYGGLVAGAFDDQNQMLGFVFGFLGIASDGHLKHCSHMLGIRPDVQHKNIGYRLKRFQRQYVLKQGWDLITWTYDSLECPNAMLNIAKLGGIVRTYIQNMYGSWEEGLNRGLVTDRFEVEWWLNSPRVRAVIESKAARGTFQAAYEAGAKDVLSVRRDANGLLHPVEPILDFNADRVLIEVPADFQTLKTTSMELAQNWRQVTRSLFTQYFARGYVVVDYLSQVAESQRRNMYLLARNVATDQE
jgi:predicted GNAT superfamily acetyltransferase